MAESEKKRKGFFGDVRLPVSKEYIYPAKQTFFFWVGGIGLLFLGAFFLIDVTIKEGVLISNGPLSSAHASFGANCATCHTPLENVSNDKCMVCHEKFGGDQGIYSYATHYLYRSTDFTRLTPSTNEVSCATCHSEHEGRDAVLDAVPDVMCMSCHEYGSFNDQHPEFEAIGSGIPDPANITFSHTRHVNEIISKVGETDLEKTCLYCHQSDPIGAGFEPISFDVSCASCHLTATSSTDWLPTGNNGVQTLAVLRAQRGPGTGWVDYMSPGDFQERSGRVRKRPVYHRDPWILENLKRLQGIMYPDNELASLLRASADVSPEDAHVLYEEALATLTTYADELRGIPDRSVQRSLSEIDDLMGEIRKRIRDPLSPLDETKFLLGSASLDPDIDEVTLSQYKELIDGLTQTCQKCHSVDNASIGRVSKDQSTFVRAEFNHRSHIIQSGCLDCHSKIPIREYAARDSVAAVRIDHAGIQNLPSIQLCQSCHTPKKAADSCITCHQFHPDKSQHSNLLRYLN